jgi:hypothetical protein
MHTYNFTLVLGGPSLGDDDLDRLFEAGCDDATFGHRLGQPIAQFDREAATFGAAVRGAIADIEETLSATEVLRVEPDDLVTAATIAERTSRTRESVRQLYEGARGPGNFPEPITWLDGTTRIWHWSQVAQWFEEKGEPAALGGIPNFVAALNAALETRRQLKVLSGVVDDPNRGFTKEDLALLPELVTETAGALQDAIADQST